MNRLSSIMGVIIILLTFVLGSDFSFTKVKAASDLSTLGELKDHVKQQLLLQKTEMNIDYSGNKDELSAHIASLLKEAFEADDYTAYIVDSYLYAVHTWGGDANIKLTVKYRETPEQKLIVQEKVRDLLPDIIQPSMSQREKVKAIHDWIVLHLAYDESLQRYTAYEALEYGQAVCQGYALLLYRMLSSAGIESRMIEGKVGEISHVWNLVNIDSDWYHLDATWDDPTPDQAGVVSYNYFLKTDAQMRIDHQWVKRYPAAVTNDSAAAASNIS
ncbi:transglutaminase domain-containing protein [Paenibacillus sepulcri]|uniref:Transglutaminase n=1 Tax=Paenibacillus sepulcri TaxID=359917 RepID=A0ABS7C7F4_9BACL|nr:transglutaminase [Paenibacillus sepulcri]